MRIPSNHCPRTLGRYTLASQYAQEQTRLSAQIASLEEQVRQLAGQYGQEQTRLAAQIASLEEQVRR